MGWHGWRSFLSSPFAGRQVNGRQVKLRPRLAAMKTEAYPGKELIPGTFLVDGNGSPYLIVNHEQFVDPMGQVFLFKSYESFVKSSLVPTGVEIEVCEPCEWRLLEAGTLVVHGQELLVRRCEPGEPGIVAFSIMRDDAGVHYSCTRVSGKVRVEPLSVTLVVMPERDVSWGARTDGETLAYLGKGLWKINWMPRRKA